MVIEYPRAVPPDAMCEAIANAYERAWMAETGLLWMRYRAEEVKGSERDEWTIRDLMSGSMIRDAAGEVMVYSPAKGAFEVEANMNHDADIKAERILRG